MDARRLAVMVIGGALVGLGGWGSPSAAWADDPPASDAGESRPNLAALHLTEADVLAGFTPEVWARRPLRDRALALWRTHFAAQADAVRDRFLREADWRPALADAAALVDDFLEASLLPRARQQWADPDHVWVEKLDPATGKRTQVLQPAPRRRVLLAPHEPEFKTSKPDLDKQDGIDVDRVIRSRR